MLLSKKLQTKITSQRYAHFVLYYASLFTPICFNNYSLFWHFESFPWHSAYYLIRVTSCHWKCAVQWSWIWGDKQMSFFFFTYKLQFHENLISHCIKLLTTDCCSEYLANLWIFPWPVMVTQECVSQTQFLLSTKYLRSPLFFPISFQFGNVKCRSICPSFSHVMSTQMPSWGLSINSVYTVSLEIQGLMEGLFKWMKTHYFQRALDQTVQ